MRKLLLATTIAIALLGFSATNAMADFEITNYETGQPCPPISISGSTVSGGCEFSLGPITIDVQWTGSPQTWCESSVSGLFRIDANGDAASGDFELPECFAAYQCGTFMGGDSLFEDAEIVALGNGEYALDINDFCYEFDHTVGVRADHPLRLNLEKFDDGEQTILFNATADMALIGENYGTQVFLSTSGGGAVGVEEL